MREAPRQIRSLRSDRTRSTRSSASTSTRSGWPVSPCSPSICSNSSRREMRSTVISRRTWFRPRGSRSRMEARRTNCRCGLPGWRSRSAKRRIRPGLPACPPPTCDGPCPSQDLPDAPPPGPPGGTFLTPNLIVNGDADSGPSGQRGAPYPGAGGAGELTGWQVFSDDPRAIVYGIPSASGGWPDDQRDIVPPTPGSGFFAGGNFSQMGNSRSLSADARRRRRRIATRR